MFGGPLRGFGLRAVVDAEPMAALGFQMSGHRIAHHAQPEKCDFSQLRLS
jgi:hypothetical protein